MTRSEKIEIVGILAVLLGLIFVGLELRQNSDLLRITATQTLAAEYGDALEVITYDDEAACIHARGINGLNNLDEVQRLRFFVQMFLVFRSAEQLHYYSLEGMVEDNVWRGFERQLIEVTNWPGVREWWEVRSSWFSDVFQEFIGDIIESRPVTVPHIFLGESCQSVDNE